MQETEKERERKSERGPGEKPGVGSFDWWCYTLSLAVREDVEKEWMREREREEDCEGQWGVRDEGDWGARRVSWLAPTYFRWMASAGHEPLSNQDGKRCWDHACTTRSAAPLQCFSSLLHFFSTTFLLAQVIAFNILSTGGIRSFHCHSLLSLFPLVCLLFSFIFLILLLLLLLLLIQRENHLTGLCRIYLNLDDISVI